MATSVRLDEETEARLHALAARTGRTKAFYLRQIIKNGLDDLEDLYDVMEISERIKRGEETTRPWSEVRRDLGLDD